MAGTAMNGEQGQIQDVGKVFQLSASPGGVPKLPIAKAVVRELGFTNDQQADRRAHGGVEQAVCLWAVEIIEALRAEGHEVFPGATGENITTEGLDWALMLPGTRLQIGADVILELTKYTTPCWKNAQWFKDGDFNRMNQATYPGSARLYAKVIQGGVVQMNDMVKLLGATARERLERQRTKKFRWPQDFPLALAGRNQ